MECWKCCTSKQAVSQYLPVWVCHGLIVCRKCWGYLRGITVALQSSHLDVYQAYKLVDYVLKALCTARLEGNKTYEEYYGAAVALTEKLDVPVTKPRTCGHQRYPANPEVSSVPDYFRISLTSPFLDHLIPEMKRRSGDGHVSRNADAFCLIPAIMAQDEG